MKLHLIAVSTVAALILTPSLATAQTTDETKVTTGTSVKNGVSTRDTKVTHVTKRKTNRPKKVLGVKVGHKTVTHKTVKETSTSTNGDSSTTVKTK